MKNHSQLAKEYNGEFIAIYNKEIMAHNVDGQIVKTEARRKLGNKKFPGSVTNFAETP